MKTRTCSGSNWAPVEITPLPCTVPRRVDLGQALTPSLWTVASDALHCGRAEVSSRVPGWNTTLIVWISFGLPAGAPGSLQVASPSRPDGEAGVCDEYVIANVAENCGLASTEPVAASANALPSNTNAGRTRQTYSDLASAASGRRGRPGS